MAGDPIEKDERSKQPWKLSILGGMPASQPSHGLGISGPRRGPGRLIRDFASPGTNLPSLSNAECLVGSIQSAASISSAIASILVTLFQLRAVPVVFNNLSIEDQGSLDLPAPLGK